MCYRMYCDAYEVLKFILKQNYKATVEKAWNLSLEVRTDCCVMSPRVMTFPPTNHKFIEPVTYFVAISKPASKNPGRTLSFLLYTKHLRFHQ